MPLGRWIAMRSRVTANGQPDASRERGGPVTRPTIDQTINVAVRLR